MKALWEQIEQNFPGWDIHHTGGGLFVIRKNFKDKNGNEVMVAVSDTMALIMRSSYDKNKFISCSDFYENENIYWGENSLNLEVPVLRLEDSKFIAEEQSEIFHQDFLDEISEAILLLDKQLEKM